MNGAVACWRRGRTFSTGTRGLAVRTDYYQLKEMSNVELAFVRKICFDNADPFLASLNRGWLPAFVGPFVLRRLAAAMRVDSPEIAEELERMVSNAHEDLHMNIEARSIGHLDALRNRDLSFVETEEVGDFLHFLAVQYFRTPRIKENVSKALDGATGIRVDHIWGLLGHVFATNVAFALFGRRKETTFSLLVAPDGAEYITTDQPVINRHAVGTAVFEQVEQLALYYPVSPTLALLVEPNGVGSAPEQREVSAAEVGQLNREMMSLVQEQAYATSEERLSALTDDR